MAAITHLATPAQQGTAAGLREIEAVLDRIDTGDVIGAEAAAAVVHQVDRVIRRLQALRLSVLAEADRSDVASGSGASGTAAWLAAVTRSDGAAASREVRLATALDDGLPATREALAAGAVSTEHAQVIATATAQLPEGLGLGERTAIETALVARAKLVDPAALRRTARRALSAAERSQAEVDAHEDRVLRSEEDRAYDRSSLTWHHHGDGTTSGHFTVPTPAAAVLVKVVQQMASPKRFARAAGARAAARGGTTGTAATGTAQLAAVAEVDWRQRYGQAFVELIEHLPTDRISGKVNATVLVTVEHDALKASLGTAHLDTGQDLSASQARRLACAAGIVPVVLGGDSLPLDLGRQERFFTEAQRVALATRYDTCCAETCDRPYAWTELHHEDPWHRGGETDLHLAVPLCGHHHRRVHDPRYEHRIVTDPGGTKSVSFTRRT